LLAAACLFLLALIPWFLTLVISPYDTMGRSVHNIRLNVAEGLLYCALASIGLLLASAILLFVGTNVRGRKALAFGILFVFFFATASAQALWVKLYVIDRVAAAS
jgi:hypothetical protein